MAASPTRRLTDDEIARFKREGYLQLRGVLDPSLCARARQILWEHNVVDRLQHDPFGPFRYHEQDFPRGGNRTAESGPPMGGTRRGYRWHLSVVGSSPLFVELVGGAAFPYAQQLLGDEETTPPRASGGIHCTLPAAKNVGRFARRRGCKISRSYVVRAITHYSAVIMVSLPSPCCFADEAHPMECHVDQSLESRERLGVVGYIDDVPPGSGAFSVWAGSHHRVYRLLRTKYVGIDRTVISKFVLSDKYSWVAGGEHSVDAATRPPRNDLRGVGAGSYGPMMTHELQSIIRDTPLTDCWGAAGDVVLYHARIAHTPGHNFGSTIRQAVITGFGKTEESLPDNELTAHVEQHDIWRDWSRRVKTCPVAAPNHGEPATTHVLPVGQRL